MNLSPFTSIWAALRVLLVSLSLVTTCWPQSKATTGWTVIAGDSNQVYLEKDTLVMSKLDRGQEALALAPGLVTNATVDVVFDLRFGLQNYGVVGRYTPAGDFYNARVYANGTKFLISSTISGKEVVLNSLNLPDPFTTGPLRIRLDMKGDQLIAELSRVQSPDNVQKLQVRDKSISEGRIGVRTLSFFPAAAALWRSVSIDGKRVPLKLGETPPAKLKTGDLAWMSLSTDASLLDLTNESWILTPKNRQPAPVQIGLSVISQGFPAGESLYTTEFSLPDSLPKADLFLLELGPISLADVTSMNGKIVGGYGNFPPLKALFASSWTPRRYVIPAALLHRDQPNRLEIKIATGTSGGIYQGPVTLKPLNQQAVLEFSLRDPDLSSITQLLSDASHLNQFVGSGFLNTRFRVAKLVPDGPKASELSVKLSLHTSDVPGRVLESAISTLSIQPGHWSSWTSLQLNRPSTPGRYRFLVEVKEGSALLYTKETELTITAAPEPLSLPAKLAKIDVPQTLAWQTVSTHTVGSFGARLANDNGLLDPAAWTQDTRGTLAPVVRTEKTSSRPLLFLNGVQRAPISPFPVEYYQEFDLGRKYDGFDDVWPAGYIQLGAANAGPGTTEFKNADWVSRSYTLRDQAGAAMGELLLSKLSPAIRLTVETNQASFFEDLNLWGLGAPSHISYSSDQGITILPNSSSVQGSRLRENWVLVWFNKSDGWEDFDMPWLFVLENRPDSIELSSKGLSFSQASGHRLGTIAAMPLYGARLLKPTETSRWGNTLDTETLRSIRRWSHTLPAFPVAMERAVAIDLEKGDTYVRERTLFDERSDAWNTPLRTTTPSSPVMALGMHSTNLAIEASEDLMDFQLTTIYGPWLGAVDKSEVIYKIPDLLRFVFEAPVLADDAPDSIQVKAARSTLNTTMRGLIKSTRLNEHPWPWSVWRSKFTPGEIQHEYSLLLSSTPYLDSSLKSEVERLLRDEVNQMFLSRSIKAGAIPRGGWSPVPGQDLYTDLHDPLTNGGFAILKEHAARRGIDTPFWESFRLYAIWQSAHYLDNWDAVQDAWKLITDIAAIQPHSHDWATLQSWDFISGYRIGNGIQESGGIYAGYIAMARMADHFGHTDERDLRAGLAVLQLIGMDVANTGIRYVRTHRPWSGRNSEAANTTSGELMFPSRYIEFNEFNGSPAQAIQAPWLFMASRSYIHDPLPDVMRVYPSIWPQENAAFFKGLTFDPAIDMVLRMEQPGADRINSVYQRQVRSPHALERLMAARALLESVGAMKWESLIKTPSPTASE